VLPQFLVGPVQAQAPAILDAAVKVAVDLRVAGVGPLNPVAGGNGAAQVGRANGVKVGGVLGRKAQLLQQRSSLAVAGLGEGIKGRKAFLTCFFDEMF